MTNKALSLALAALLVANSMTASLAQAGPLGTMSKVAGPAAPVLSALTDEEDESGREAAFTAGVTAALTAGTVGVATESAATALAVGVVGGPVILAGLLAGGTAAAAYGVYKGVRYVMK